MCPLTTEQSGSTFSTSDTICGSGSECNCLIIPPLFSQLYDLFTMVDDEIQFEASSECSKISSLFLSKLTVKCVLDLEGVQGKAICSHNNIELFMQDHNNFCVLQHCNIQ